MIEAEEVGSAKVEEVESAGIMKVTQPFGKQTEILEEPSEEGGAFMPNTIGKLGPLLATIVVRSANVKRSVERKEASNFHNSGSHPKTTEACSS